MVKIMVSLPDSLAALLGNDEQIVQQQLLEDAVSEAFRKGSITRGDVATYLKHSSWYETEKFFNDHKILLGYNLQDIKHDLGEMSKFLNLK